MAGFIAARTVAPGTGPDTAPNPPKTLEQEGAEHYDRQREAVIDERVTFLSSREHPPWRRHRRRQSQDYRGDFRSFGDPLERVASYSLRPLLRGPHL
jgi:hypothetical protein